MSGRPCAPKRKAVLDRAHAVFVQGAALLRASGQIVVAVLLGIDRAALENGDPLVEHARVAESRRRSDTIA